MNTQLMFVILAVLAVNTWQKAAFKPEGDVNSLVDQYTKSDLHWATAQDTFGPAIAERYFKIFADGLKGLGKKFNCPADMAYSKDS